MGTTKEISYLRAGRTKRGTGDIILADTSTGMFKVKPKRKGWKSIWISVSELQQGGTVIAAQAHHIPAVGKMVDGLRELLARKEGVA